MEGPELGRQSLRQYSYFEYLGINTHFSWARTPCECPAAVELTVGREVLPGGYPDQCSKAQRAGIRPEVQRGAHKARTSIGMSFPPRGVTERRRAAARWV
jgi:hypothetical protein